MKSQTMNNKRGDRGGERYERTERVERGGERYERGGRGGDRGGDRGGERYERIDRAERVDRVDEVKSQDSDRVSPAWFKDGDPKNHILNENNKLITTEFINKLFKTYGLEHKVQNLELFQLAMIHISYLNRSTVTDKTARMLRDVIPIETNKRHLAMPLKDKDYGRLEYLGDAKIHDILAEYLFERYETEDEGFLTKLRTKIEKAETLSELSKKLRLHHYAIVARNIEQSGGRLTNIHLTEDIFEAFVGALSREITFERLKCFIVKIVENELDMAEMIYLNDNYKEQLMQHFHQVKWGEPKYIEDIDSQKTVKEGCQEIRYFTTYVKNNVGEIIGIGTGNTKTRADQNAAHAALINLNVVGEEDTSSDYYGELSDDDMSDASDNGDNEDAVGDAVGDAVEDAVDDDDEYFEEI
jgi:ribonuclease-3